MDAFRACVITPVPVTRFHAVYDIIMLYDSRFRDREFTGLCRCGIHTDRAVELLDLCPVVLAALVDAHLILRAVDHDQIIRTAALALDLFVDVIADCSQELSIGCAEDIPECV